MSFSKSAWNFYLAYIFWTVKARALIFTRVFLAGRPFLEYQQFWHRDLDLKFDLPFEKFNLANNFWIMFAEALIFHTEYSIRQDISMWPCDLGVWLTFWKV